MATPKTHWTQTLAGKAKLAAARARKQAPAGPQLVSGTQTTGGPASGVDLVPQLLLTVQGQSFVLTPADAEDLYRKLTAWQIAAPLSPAQSGS